MTPERVIRLSLDLNVLYADQKAKDRGVRGTAASMLVDAMRDGICPAGPVQLITSVPVIENWADVLRRHFGYTPEAASEKAALLYEYASDGPVAAAPRIVVGSGHVPFGTEQQVLDSIRVHAKPENADKLFDEVADDRHVLLAALAGAADILATSDIDLFTKGNAVTLERSDVAFYPFSGRTLVIAKPSFIAHWLRLGIVPDHAFAEVRPDLFALKDRTAPARP